MNLSYVVDQVGNWNPQLFREIKGKLTPRNLGLAIALSVIAQFFLFWGFKNKIPLPNANYDLYREGFTHRYCLGSPPYNWQGYDHYGGVQTTIDNFCRQDMLGQWILNWQLWWLDLFITLSILGILGLLVVGTYLLIADLAKEESQGTLNFIRLSPQSARGIFVGKLLGVPSLVYLVAILGIPLHFLAGVKASIPIPLILGFYSVLIASCALFYNLALLGGLISPKLGGFQAFLLSGATLFFLFIMMAATFDGRTLGGHPFDWIVLFYPGTILPYLVDGSLIAPKMVHYFNISDLHQLEWYGGNLWQNATTGIGFVLLNYALWTYWITQGLKRRFRNPSATLLSKPQSYGLSLSFIVVLLGFALQTSNASKLADNMAIIQGFMAIFFFILMVALSPHRQTLRDWARYRHQMPQNRRSLGNDLLFGEKSPSLLAIAANLALITLYILPTLLIFPFKAYIIPVFVGFVVGINMILIYAMIAQTLLMMKSNKRVIWTTVVIGGLMILPLMYFGIMGISPHSGASAWLFTFIPMTGVQSMQSFTMLCLSILGQWTAIAGGTLILSRKLRKAGESDTKTLLSARLPSGVS